MIEREAFIEAIAAQPYEDTPRLIFADWLQENGEEDRAEFVRLACELARPVPRGESHRAPDRFRHIAALFTANWQKWFGALLRALGADEPEHTDGKPYHASAGTSSASISRSHPYRPTPLANRTYFLDRVGIDRGFALSLSLRTHHRTRPCSLTEAFRCEPITGLELSFATNSGSGREFLTPALSRLHWLFLNPEGPAHPATVTYLGDLLNSPHWSGLKSLALSNVGQEPTTPAEWVGEAVRPDWVKNLTAFSASLTDDGLSHLLTFLTSDNLESLGLYSSRLSVGAIGALAGLRVLPRLKELDLSSGELGARHIEALAATANWGSLEELNLSFNAIGDEGAFALSHWPVLRNLRELELSGTELSGEGMLAVANAVNSKRIERLSFTYDDRLEPEADAELREQFGDKLDLSRLD